MNKRNSISTTLWLQTVSYTHLDVYKRQVSGLLNQPPRLSFLNLKVILITGTQCLFMYTWRIVLLLLLHFVVKSQSVFRLP